MTTTIELTKNSTIKTNKNLKNYIVLISPITNITTTTETIIHIKIHKITLTTIVTTLTIIVTTIIPITNHQSIWTNSIKIHNAHHADSEIIQPINAEHRHT